MNKYKRKKRKYKKKKKTSDIRRKVWLSQKEKLRFRLFSRPANHFFQDKWFFRVITAGEIQTVRVQASAGNTYTFKKCNIICVGVHRSTYNNTESFVGCRVKILSPAPNNFTHFRFTSVDLLQNK